MPGRQFGSIDGVAVGQVFTDRRELSQRGIHRHLQAGITGSAATGCESIVLSGGYVDDEDHGDVVIYTGEGGRNINSGRQEADQVLRRGNRSLVTSCELGLPVRVVRGHRHRSPWSPPVGYMYAGLYFVDSYWSETGRDGFLIWRFRLIANSSGQDIAPVTMDNGSPTQRIEVISQRIVRSTVVAATVKALHGMQCQVCGTVIHSYGGTFYAEAAHIRPLGRPHDGPDIVSNVLCLCPNHHTAFDLGGFVIEDDLTVRSTSTGTVLGNLRLHHNHPVDLEQLRYHRRLFLPDD